MPDLPPILFELLSGIHLGVFRFEDVIKITYLHPLRLDAIQLGKR
jgi:hypothetical protein